jgi:hypothetical protein
MVAKTAPFGNGQKADSGKVADKWPMVIYNMRGTSTRIVVASVYERLDGY